VRDEVLQVLLVCLRVETFTPNPLHGVPAGSKGRRYHSGYYIYRPI
jgi:hypothetical protein